MQILTKRESTDCYKEGIFGNHLRQWDTPEQALADCSSELMIRYRGKGSSGPAVACATAKSVKNWWHLLTRVQGFAAKDLYVSERCPDHKLTFQGEICEAPHVGGYSLHWSQEKTFARQALQQMGGHHRQGPGAKLMCKQFMDRDSYDELLNLFDAYPLHTVEFSCFSLRLGNLRRNTIFWEVRNC